MVEKTSSLATTETHFVITEAADMSFDVKHGAVIAGTEQKAHLRPSHLIGQLICAAILLAVENYDSIKAEMAPVERETKKPGVKTNK